MNCASCGYAEAYHDLGTKRCPKETADKNGRRGTFKVPEDVPRKLWYGLQVPLSPAELKKLAEAVDKATTIAGPPEVPARPPAGFDEVAGYRGKQAVGLGRHAIGLGWTVSALYWRGPDGVEGCGVWLAKDALRAVATWKRAAGKVGSTSGWATDTAYAWRTDVAGVPTKLTHTQLEEIIE